MTKIDRLRRHLLSGSSITVLESLAHCGMAGSTFQRSLKDLRDADGWTIESVPSTGGYRRYYLQPEEIDRINEK